MNFGPIGNGAIAPHAGRKPTQGRQGSAAS